MKDTMTANVEQLRDGLRIVVCDDQTDSLAILEVRNSDFTELLSVKVGLRGNFDVNKRPIRYTYVTMPAPKISREVRNQRKADYWQTWGYR